MGYVKDMFTETVEELEFHGASASPEAEALITAFMEGRVETTGGLLPKRLEADLRVEPEMFLESWRQILQWYADAAIDNDTEAGPV